MSTPAGFAEAAGAPRVDGSAPRFVARPQDDRQAARDLAECRAAGLAAIPVGGGTKLGFGMPPRRADVLVATSGLAGIVHYEPADLVCAVRAGTRLADVQAELAASGQRLPLDRSPADATVGGAFATAAAGPRRASLGAPRDRVLGVTVALPDATVARAGGRVVKNVTGYDLMKLHGGALGTLGLVTEICFRLAPLPARETGVAATFRSWRSAASLLARVFRSNLEPSITLVLGPDAHLAVPSLPRADWVLVSASEGPESSRARHRRELEAWAGEADAESIDPLDDDAMRALDQELAGADDAFTARAPLAARARISAPPASWTALVDEVQAASEARGVTALWEVRAAPHGLLHLRAGGDGAAERRSFEKLVATLRARARQYGGLTTWERLPTAMKRAVGVWPEPGGALQVMKELKRALDPGAVLNPGRFVGGL